jgi:transglycosylase-like protein with SLT domain
MDFEGFIRETALRHNLLPATVMGLVSVESNGNPWAWNPEPRYRYFWDVRKRAPFRPVSQLELSTEVPPDDFPTLAGDRDQEWWGQQASWGLMQIMGARARENGFVGLYLTELCSPSVNLDLGCHALAQDLRWAGGDYERALAGYNGGHSGNSTRPFRNQSYATKVLNATRHFT